MSSIEGGSKLLSREEQLRLWLEEKKAKQQQKTRTSNQSERRRSPPTSGQRSNTLSTTSLSGSKSENKKVSLFEKGTISSRLKARPHTDRSPGESSGSRTPLSTITNRVDRILPTTESKRKTASEKLRNSSSSKSSTSGSQKRNQDLGEVIGERDVESRNTNQKGGDDRDCQILTFHSRADSHVSPLSQLSQPFLSPQETMDIHSSNWKLENKRLVLVSRKSDSSKTKASVITEESDLLDWRDLLSPDQPSQIITKRRTGASLLVLPTPSPLETGSWFDESTPMTVNSTERTDRGMQASGMSERAKREMEVDLLEGMESTNAIGQTFHTVDCDNVTTDSSARKYNEQTSKTVSDDETNRLRDSLSSEGTPQSYFTCRTNASVPVGNEPQSIEKAPLSDKTPLLDSDDPNMTTEKSFVTEGIKDHAFVMDRRRRKKQSTHLMDGEAGVYSDYFDSPSTMEDGNVNDTQSTVSSCQDFDLAGDSQNDQVENSIEFDDTYSIRRSDRRTPIFRRSEAAMEASPEHAEDSLGNVNKSSEFSEDNDAYISNPGTPNVQGRLQSQEVNNAEPVYTNPNSEVRVLGKVTLQNISEEPFKQSQHSSQQDTSSYSYENIDPQQLDELRWQVNTLLTEKKKLENKLYAMRKGYENRVTPFRDLFEDVRSIG